MFIALFSESGPAQHWRTVTVGPYTRGADHVREARAGAGVRAGNPERALRDNNQG